MWYSLRYVRLERVRKSPKWGLIHEYPEYKVRTLTTHHDAALGCK